MHKYNTPKCNGQVFSFDIIDEEGCEIRITSFDKIADLHYHRIEQGASYVMSKGTMKDANKVYNKLNSHLEIILTKTSVLKCSTPDAIELEKKTCFKPINELLTTTNNTLGDVIGVVVNVREISMIRRKDGSTINKRIVKINDMSTLTIDVNLWGPPSEQLGSDLKNMHTSGTFVILAVQNARMKLQDHTGTIWANAFDEVGTELLSLSAKELYMLQYDLTIEKTPRNILKKAMFKHYSFTALVSTDTYKSERKIKVTINKVQRLNFKADFTCLLVEIARMRAAA
ncbi:replication protein A 70 kDa DNA-binding subunit E-like [Cryptomeria japonica]|uniref:replication protein A 70 kDa DNA-binding subunit E-like n=1 Tax=Cryptomeria japonica TaxID=3369 RepID=UPI0027DA8B5D|nr:replication protein A 70 kDa DNA-binding subunit E-like [Cryptomeria japonica]